ncbi:hypothetical protein DFQ28_005465 [Apophysomyces sp. BC1034]|nr:hypothetical protein DFQ30_005548 [Apophysomyces sp. BC1015]KAG0177717.1 hypothetical protein DFQ29_004509 [Apophysomyces sp. BC1021]KAG0188037.1 hypothetical protein DFQ28_005465 [Apophysomyces sp. BC1034]
MDSDTVQKSNKTSLHNIFIDPISTMDTSMDIEKRHEAFGQSPEESASPQTPDSGNLLSTTALDSHTSSMTTTDDSMDASLCDDRISTWSLNRAVDTTSMLDTPRTRRFVARLLGVSSEDSRGTAYSLLHPTTVSYVGPTDDSYGQLVVDQQHLSKRRHDSAFDYEQSLIAGDYPSQRYALRSTPKRREYQNARHGSVSSNGTGNEEEVIKAKRRKLWSHNNSVTHIHTVPGWDIMETKPIDEDASESFQPTKSHPPIHQISPQELVPVTIGKSGGVISKNRRRRPCSIVEKLNRLSQQPDTNLDLSYHSVLPQPEEGEAEFESTDLLDKDYGCPAPTPCYEPPRCGALAEDCNIKPELPSWSTQETQQNPDQVQCAIDGAVQPIEIIQPNLPQQIVQVNTPDLPANQTPAISTTDKMMHESFRTPNESSGNIEMDIDEQTSNDNECISEPIPPEQSTQLFTTAKSYTSSVIEKLSRLILGV